MQGFSLSLGPAKRAQGVANRVHEDDAPQERQQLTELSGEGPKKKRKIKAIPALANSLTSKAKSQQPEPKGVGKLDDKFEAAIQPAARQEQYGLVAGLRELAEGQGAVGHEKISAKHDLKGEDKLPDAPESEAYELMPVADFGRALLAGMGYRGEQRVPTVEYIARPSRMGLGTKPGDVVSGKKSYKELVTEDGSVKSVRREGDKLIDTATLGPKKGKQMLVISGQHQGLQCIVQTVVEDVSDGMVRVRLLPSEHDVTLAATALTEPGAPEYAQHAERDRAQTHESRTDAGAPQQESTRPRGTTGAERDGSCRDREGQRAADGSSSRRRGEDRHAGEERTSSRAGTSTGTAGTDGSSGRGKRIAGDRRGGETGRQAHERAQGKSWLLESIRVRVVSKTHGRGKLYLKKGVVICITAPGECDVRMDETGHVVEGLLQSQLESVVPKAKGTALIVLRGEHKARHARLLEKRSTAAAIQLTDNMDIITEVLDNLAEFVGDMEGEDY